MSKDEIQLELARAIAETETARAMTMAGMTPEQKLEMAKALKQGEVRSVL